MLSKNPATRAKQDRKPNPKPQGRVPKQPSKPEKPDRVAKTGTYGEIAQAFLKRDYPTVKRLLDQDYKAQRLTYRVVNPAEAPLVERSDTVGSSDEISYWDYSPPPLWQPPYAILRVVFTDKKKTHLMVHAGEEVIVPVSGEIEYDFWEYGHDAAEPGRVTRGPCRPGHIWRINPAVPHHTRAVAGIAEAWIVLRELRDTSASIRRAPSASPDGSKVHHTRQWADAELRRTPSRFLLSTTLLSEKIRLFRARSGLSVQDLADRCGVDRVFLSRVEEGTINLSLTVAIRIAEFLGFDPIEALEEGFWDCQPTEPIQFSGNSDVQQVSELAPADKKQWLHFRHLRLEKGETRELHDPHRSCLGVMTSWVALKGKVDFQGLHNEHDTSAFLRTGSVLHLKVPQNIKVEAYDASELLEVRHSPISPTLAIQ
jgi:transcriptional regulator with XRE-family HTH domain